MSTLKVVPSSELNDPKFQFRAHLKDLNIELAPESVTTLQINITKLCNQACHHCHVDSSPKRTEQMSKECVDRCLEILAKYPEIKNLDLTGGAPELNPHFRYIAKEARKLGKNVMVRHNLTVTFDPHPTTGESMEYLPEFYADNQLEIISSLPYYQEYFTDKQRGSGVFQKSIKSLQLLNEKGYGLPGSHLSLNLVYNPVGAFLPANQETLEATYKKELQDKFGISFHNLFVITNMPIHRFKDQLIELDQYGEYMTKLVNAFNPHAANGIMCRSIISVSFDGKLYDCDFNQMLEMQLEEQACATIFDFDIDKVLSRKIQFASHCFGCTAGSGSSCGGETS